MKDMFGFLSANTSRPSNRSNGRTFTKGQQMKNKGIDTRMRFALEPSPGDNTFEQWKDAMKAVARLPLGIPDEFRKKFWLNLADNHVKGLKIDWAKTVKFAFNEKSNPDDNKLGLQIVKDLHRTGCSGFSGQDNEEDRAILKRVLLAYARWNKRVGYCQGFNVIAALLLEVMECKEDEALKVMIYLIDHVLPESYFANNLRALSVDMAVFRDLLHLTHLSLSKHLDHLQYAAQDKSTGSCYEPPLTNVFTMQWFLTLFATCLPKKTVLRVWDSILLEGSEILLRTALVIWGKLSSRIMSVASADEFYTLMGDLTQEMLEGKTFDADTMIKSVYALQTLPLPQLSELREKYTYNIHPFSATGNTVKRILPSDDDDFDDEDIEAINCFAGILSVQNKGVKSKGDGEGGSGTADISAVGPGAYSIGMDADVMGGMPAYMERMTTDIGALKKQYAKLRERQNQAHIILAAASAKHRAKTRAMVPRIETPGAVNHLFVGKLLVGSKNRFVTEGPRIAQIYPKSRYAGPRQTALGVTKMSALVTGSPQRLQKISENRKDNLRISSSDDRKNNAIGKDSENLKVEVSKIDGNGTDSENIMFEASKPDTIANDSEHLKLEACENDASVTDKTLKIDENKTCTIGNDVLKTDVDNCFRTTLGMVSDSDQTLLSKKDVTVEDEVTSRDAEISGRHKFEVGKSVMDASNNLENSAVNSEDTVVTHIDVPGYCSKHNENEVFCQENEKQNSEILKNVRYCDCLNFVNLQEESPSHQSREDDRTSTEDSIACIATASLILEHTAIQKADIAFSDKDTDSLASNTLEDKDETHSPMEFENTETVHTVDSESLSLSSLSDDLVIGLCHSLDCSPKHEQCIQLGSPVSDKNIKLKSLLSDLETSQLPVQLLSDKPETGPFHNVQTRSHSVTQPGQSSTNNINSNSKVVHFSQGERRKSESVQKGPATFQNGFVRGSELCNTSVVPTPGVKHFNPFPVKHVNQNRAKTGLKLGLYKQTSLKR